MVTKSVLPALDEFPRLRDVAARAVDRFISDVRVTGLIVGGSLARGGIDAYSDVDLYVIVRDEDFEAVFAERDAAAESVGAPLFRFIADHNPGGEHDYIILYEGPAKLDLMYLRASDVTPAEKWAKSLILTDSDAFLETVKARSHGVAPPRPAPEALLIINQKFWTWCWYVFGKIARGELWEAFDGIHNIRSLAILPMMAWTCEWRPEGYRRLESKLAACGIASTAAEATIAGTLHPVSLYAALRAEIELFLDIRARLGERYGLRVDTAAAEQTLRSELERRWTKVHETLAKKPGQQG